MPITSTKRNGKKKRGRPPKKKTQRKATKKAVINKDAPKDKYFVLCNGKPVKNIKELAELMDNIEEHVFNHHVKVDGNDFAQWVEDIFKDLELAQKLAGVMDKKHMQLVIYKHITHKLW